MTPEVKTAILEAQVNAALQGHDIGPFEPIHAVAGGYQAVCRRCGSTVWVNDNGKIFSLLADHCPGRDSQKPSKGF